MGAISKTPPVAPLSDRALDDILSLLVAPPPDPSFTFFPLQPPHSCGPFPHTSFPHPSFPPTPPTSATTTTTVTFPTSFPTTPTSFPTPPSSFPTTPTSFPTTSSSFPTTQTSFPSTPTPFPTAPPTTATSPPAPPTPPPKIITLNPSSLSGPAPLPLPARRRPGKKPATRRFACRLCSNTFSRKDNLATHARVHTGERPYGCATCGRRFMWPSSARTHALTHTRRLAKANAESAAVKLEPLPVTPFRRHAPPPPLYAPPQAQPPPREQAWQRPPPRRTHGNQTLHLSLDELLEAGGAADLFAASIAR